MKFFLLTLALLAVLLPGKEDIILVRNALEDYTVRTVDVKPSQVYSNTQKTLND